MNTNVEFSTALLLHGLGLPAELFTPAFAAGHGLGWSAHCLEQLREGRLIRPQSSYIGPVDLRYDHALTKGPSKLLAGAEFASVAEIAFPSRIGCRAKLSATLASVL